MNDFAGWRNRFRGESVVVVGCGPSAHNTDPRAFLDYWTMGCNRAVQFCEPDFATCVEPFDDPVWPIIRDAGVPVVFSHADASRVYKTPHPRIVAFPDRDVSRWAWTDWELGPLECPMSPYWATAVCGWLGFERIGLIGVDLTRDRFGDIKREDAKWHSLAVLLKMHGSEVVNLSQMSRLTIAEAPWSAIRPKRHFSMIAHTGGRFFGLEENAATSAD